MQTKLFASFDKEVVLRQFRKEVFTFYVVPYVP